MRGEDEMKQADECTAEPSRSAPDETIRGAQIIGEDVVGEAQLGVALNNGWTDATIWARGRTPMRRCVQAAWAVAVSSWRAPGWSLATDPPLQLGLDSRSS